MSVHAETRDLPARVRSVPDEVLDFEDLGLARELDPDLAEDRHHLPPECLQLLSGFPDLAHPQFAVGAEETVHLEAVRVGPRSGCLEPPHRRVVLLAREACGVETNDDAHVPHLHTRGPAEPNRIARPDPSLRPKHCTPSNEGLAAYPTGA